ncbi:MAG: carboxypeptidase-like regulatory domain-containing protein [Bacteroidaceae bacterium]|nr:carboxypeptidase-like regulatory domain-containing protein [Bacteroidaceae bacterium]
MKRIFLFAMFAIVAATAQPQSTSTISGKIVNSDGNAVEYAIVGIMGKRTGTLTNAEGVFTLDITDACNDTLLITHVSYENAKVAVAMLPCDGEACITMKAKELAEAVIYPGKKKSAKIAGKGMRIPGALTKMAPENRGNEIGSLVETKKLFEVQEIEFDVTYNSLKDAQFSVNIYKADSTNGQFCNALCKPVYVDIPTSTDKQKIHIAVDKRVILEAGKYFVSLMLVDYAEQDKAGYILFPLFLKGSYIRNGVMDEFESTPVNMGLAVKGVEYR